jgi:hypothetical protein
MEDGVSVGVTVLVVTVVMVVVEVKENLEKMMYVM